MIRSHRCLDAPSLGARHEVVAWVEHAARMHVVRTTQLVCDDRLYQLAFGRADSSRRALVTVVLDGCAHLASGELRVALGPGDGLFLPAKGALSIRTEGERYQSVVLEWDAATSAAPRSLRVDRDLLTKLASEFCAAEVPDRTVLERVLATLRASGAPLDDVYFETSEELGPKELRAQEIADAIDAVLSSLDRQPMAADLETRLGVSPRQVTRMVEAFRARYGYGATNWQRMRNWRRLMLAATLLTAPGAAVAEVARVVGYNRPETLARAFSVAGLPKPSTIEDYVRALGVDWRAETSGAETGMPRGGAPAH